MKHIFTLLAGTTIILSSCSSTHKAAQTPDDVYYSPATPRNTVAARNSDGDEYYSTAPSDNYVRMKSVDPNRWSYFDDYSNYDAYYSPMSVGIGYGVGMGYGYYAGYPGFGFDPYFGWNSYFMWNTCYNPYFYNPYFGAGVVVVNPKLSGTSVYTHLRTFNPGSYSNNNRFANGNNSNRFYRPTRAVTTGSRTNNPGNYRYNNGNNNSYRPANTNTGGGSTRSFNSQPVRTFSAPTGGGGGGGGFRPGRH
ncbi:MAG: hypothetical protein Q8937_14660 [Bacteroidota bacterium]|nr:hypothetical protein [Bacteroidota bacterium]